MRTLRASFAGILALLLALPAVGQIINPGVYNITATGSNGVTVSPSPCLPGSICDISLTPLATMKFLANTTGGSAVPIATALPLDVTLGGTGATTAANARTNLGLGTMAVQNAIAVAITGGAIDGTTLGGVTPAAGTFTTLAATGLLTAKANNAVGIAINGRASDGIGGLQFYGNDGTTAYANIQGRSSLSMFFNTGAGTTQVVVSHTASAARYHILTGSVAGNPTWDVSAGSLAITPAVVGTSSFTGTAFIPSSSTIPTNGLYLPGANNPGIAANSTKVFDCTTSTCTLGSLTMLQATAGSFAAGVWSRDSNWGTYYKSPLAGTSADIALFDSTGANSIIVLGSSVYLGGATSLSSSLEVITVASAGRRVKIAGSVSGGPSVDTTAGPLSLAPTNATGVQLGGGTALTLTAGAVGMPKITASASAPGASGGKLELVCGTNAGTAKLVLYAGTSGTAVTIVDNTGTGVTGC